MMKNLIIAATCLASTALMAMEMESKPQKVVEHIKSITGKDGLKKKIKDLNINLKNTAICFDFDENLVMPIEEYTDENGSGATWHFPAGSSNDLYADQKSFKKTEKKFQVPEKGLSSTPTKVAHNKRGVSVTHKNILMEDKEKLKDLILWLKQESAWVGVCSAGSYSDERGKILVELGFGNDIQENYLKPAKYARKFPSLLEHLNNLNNLKHNKQLPLSAQSAQNIENVILIDNDINYSKEIDLPMKDLISSKGENPRINKENLKMIVLVNNRFNKMSKNVAESYQNAMKWLDKHENK